MVLHSTLFCLLLSIFLVSGHLLPDGRTTRRPRKEDPEEKRKTQTRIQGRKQRYSFKTEYKVKLGQGNKFAIKKEEAEFFPLQWTLACLSLDSYILKVKKFAEPLFQSKKIADKVRKSGRHFWAIWGNFGPFWIIFGPFWVILGYSRPFGVIFGSFLGHFVAYLDKFAESSIFLRPRWGRGTRF